MVKLKNVSLLTGYMNCNSEKLFDIIPQLEAQCPVVDGMIKDADSNIRDIEMAIRYSEDQDSLIEQLEDSKWYIGNLEDDYEKLRESIIEIRAWGQEWKNLAKYLMESMEVDEVLELTNLDYDKKEELKEVIEGAVVCSS